MDKPWERIGCPVDVPYMPRICPASLKRRDIYGATAEEVCDKQVFGCCYPFLDGVLAIIRTKTSIMAKLSGPVIYEGNFDHIPLW
jgi:hypothetical protein